MEIVPLENIVPARAGYMPLAYPTSSAVCILSRSPVLLESLALVWIFPKIAMPITDKMAIMETTTSSSTRVNPYVFTLSVLVVSKVEPVEVGRNFFISYL